MHGHRLAQEGRRPGQEGRHPLRDRDGQVHHGGRGVRRRRPPQDRRCRGRHRPGEHRHRLRRPARRGDPGGGAGRRPGRSRGPGTDRPAACPRGRTRGRAGSIESCSGFIEPRARSGARRPQRETACGSARARAVRRPRRGSIPARSPAAAPADGSPSATSWPRSPFRRRSQHPAQREPAPSRRPPPPRRRGASVPQRLLRSRPARSTARRSRGRSAGCAGSSPIA